ncbi:hypothetical protein GA0070216_1388 [Micromonospora matsumotoense]|uniref:WxL domain surface cell wall-binding n=1 Tax=Micromonospora matsumotoense TaxID=121616 RepID=A0A1C5AXK0_9ACTN|nr:hypothetical protein [Micromonospora matsumotoense]SCF49781.1 hypothetical protein GA0070216_1388 [Micromonospora matsumotoense]
MRKRLLAAGLTGLALVAGLATPAQAADTGTTTVTFTVTGAGGLDITVPANVNLGSGTAGATVSGQLGPVTVIDQRASLTPNWVATVSGSDFTTGGATSEETIPSINVTYWSGPATSTAGTGTFTPGQPTAGDAVIINVPRTAFSHTGGTGSNFAIWNPTVSVAIPSAAVGGTYTGTVTHSVL